MPKLHVTHLVQTCLIAPCQFEGRTDDDRPIYIHFRRGYLTVSVGEHGGTIADAVNGEEVFRQYCGPGEDGEIIDYERLRELLAAVAT